MAERCVAALLCAWFVGGCGLTTSSDETAPGEPERTPGVAEPSPTGEPEATPGAAKPMPTTTPGALPPPVATATTLPSSTPPTVSGREPTCGTDWDNALAEVPSELGVAGTLNGEEFTVPLERLHVELDCSVPGQPPPIHFGFTLDELKFVIRRCDGIAYLPDNTGIALETDVAATSATIKVDSDGPSGGRFRLIGSWKEGSEPLELEFSLAVPLSTSGITGFCPG